LRESGSGTIRDYVPDIAVDAPHGISYRIGEIAPDVVPYIFSGTPFAQAVPCIFSAMPF